MQIHDILIIDLLFGTTIRLDEDTHEPIHDWVELSGDNDNDGVWTVMRFGT